MKIKELFKNPDNDRGAMMLNDTFIPLEYLRIRYENLRALDVLLRQKKLKETFEERAVSLWRNGGPKCVEVKEALEAGVKYENK